MILHGLHASQGGVAGEGGQEVSAEVFLGHPHFPSFYFLEMISTNTYTLVSTNG